MFNKVKKVFAAILISSAVVLSSASVSFADYPIFSQRYTADPTGIEYNGRLYLYCSHDNDGQSEYVISDITCISTDDMKNWTDHGEVFVPSKDCKWGATKSWAPQIVYRNNKFYLYYGNGGSAIGVAVSDSPTGPFKDLATKPLVDSNTPGVMPANNMWLFDPGVFVDDDGQAYMYFGGNGESNIRVIKLGDDMVSTVGSATTMTAPLFFEASYLHKYNGKYYFSYSSNFSKGAATIEYMMSDKPTSGFQYKGTVLPNPPDNSGNNNHHSIFTFKGDWYIAYHNRYVAMQNKVDTTYQRNVCIDRLEYNADGTIKKVTITKDGLPQLKYVDPYVKNLAVTMAEQNGIETEECGEGGRNLAFIENGDWIRVRGVDFGDGATSFEARVASATDGGNIELRLDSPTGKLVGTCAVPSTGDWQTYQTETCSVSGATGVHDLYLKFTGGSGYLFNVSWWKFNSAAPQPTVIYGDVNGDKIVDALDFATLKQYLMGTITDFPYENGKLAADVNLDNSIDAIDFANLKQYLLGSITLPVGK